MVEALAAETPQVGNSAAVTGRSGVPVIVAALSAVLLVQACTPDPGAEADKQEAAIAGLQVFAEKYGASDEGKVINPYPGRGSLAGRPVQCGVAVSSPGRYDGPSPRIMRVGKTNTIEGAIGEDPAVFEELWRRAGC